MIADFNFIVDRLEKGVWDDRIKACNVLADSNDPRAWEPLVRALRDHEVEVRTAACRALMKLGDPRSVDPLLSLLSDETHLPLRCLAIEALARYQDKQVAPLFIEFLTDSEVEVRVASCKALGQIGADSAVDALIEALHDPSLYVRSGACETLGMLKQIRAIRPLIRQLGDFEPMVRKSALEALRRLGEHRLVYAYSQAIQSATPDLTLLSHMAEQGDVRVVSPLLRQLEDEWINELARDRLVQVLEALYTASKRCMESLLCTTHLTRFEERVANLPLSRRVRYVACRICGSTVQVVSAQRIRAVLDDNMSHPHQFDAGTLRIKWSVKNDLFDFNEVEIGAVDDKDAARLCMLMGNDTDPFRRRLYASSICYVKRTGRLTENTRHLLRRTFASVRG